MANKRMAFARQMIFGEVAVDYSGLANLVPCGCDCNVQRDIAGIQSAGGCGARVSAVGSTSSEWL